VKVGLIIITFRDALPDESDKLTQLSLDSKAYWGYPREWIALWTEELTISPDYIMKNMVVVAEEKTEILGYISIIEEIFQDTVRIGEHNISHGFFLDNMFILPSHIKKGIGKKLFEIAIHWCRKRQIRKLYIDSDPNAKKFYEKMGAVYIGEIESNKIVGRTRPILILIIEGDSGSTEPLP